MKRRERVLKAIRHETADRVPIDLGVHFSTGISAFAYQNLREYLNMPKDDILICDNGQMLARVAEDVLERFHCDCMLLNLPHERTAEWNPRGKYVFRVNERFKPRLDERGNWIAETPAAESPDGPATPARRSCMPEGGFFFDGNYPFPNDFSGYEDMITRTAKRAEWIYKETDYFTMLMGFSAYFDGIEFACDMYTDPDGVIEYQKKRLEAMTERIKLVIRNMGSYIQAIEINADMGTQTAAMINPAMYEKFCLPYLKSFCKFVHDNSDIKLFLHSCGAIEELLPYIIEAGVDILNPVQISAGRMDPAHLKSKYGKDICFWGGGCDTQTVLGVGAPEDVARNVKKLVRIFKPGGGFVFNQVHNIMGNVPPENIVAMLDTAYAESAY